jgi:metallo-beta-lactamase family protein
LASKKIDFSLQGIKALLATHCHIDHVGRIPYLLAAGFDGPIYATEATAHLLPLVIEDAM